MEPLDSMPEKEPKPMCPNCGGKMPRSAKFCPHCGQKKFNGRIPFSELTMRFVHNLLHVDSKILRTSTHLLVPGKISSDFFAGKIKRYPHPLQFFFVVMFFFLFFLNNAAPDSNPLSLSFSVSDGNTKAQQKLTQNLFSTLRRYAFTKEYQNAYNGLPDSLHSVATDRLLDTLAWAVNRDAMPFIQVLAVADSTEASVSLLDSIPMNLFQQRLKVASTDIVDMEPNDIATKYGITNWRDKLLLKQGIKTFRDPNSLQKSYLGNLAWTILAVIAFMALLLKLIFRKSAHYYTEHFIFLLNLHTSLILFVTISLGFIWAGVPRSLLQLLLVLGSLGFTFFALKNFYKMGYPKTLGKFLLFLPLYTLFFFVFFIIGMLASFFLF